VDLGGLQFLTSEVPLYRLTEEPAPQEPVSETCKKCPYFSFGKYVQASIFELAESKAHGTG